MSIPFYCTEQAIDGVTSAPTAEDMEVRGGGYFNGVFVLNNGYKVRSPSATCKRCMTREGSTNEWRGPRHVILFVNNRWIPFAATEFYKGKDPIQIN